MDERDSFVFHREWVEGVKRLPKEFRLDIYEAIIEYALSGKMPTELKPVAELGFMLVKSRIDFDREKHEKACAARAEAGRRSGEARRTKRTNVNFVEQKGTKRTNVNFVEQTLNKNEQNEHIYDICYLSTEKETLSKERAKKKFGERVSMTEEEHAKLCETFGEQLVNEHIPMADDWLLSKGETRKDYAAFMRNWLKKASAQNRQVVRRGQQAPISRLKSPDLEQSAKDLTARGIRFADFSAKTAANSRPNAKDGQVVEPDDKPPF